MAESVMQFDLTECPSHYRIHDAKASLATSIQNEIPVSNA